MVLNVFSTLLISDEPERIFSISSYLLSPRYRQLNGKSVEMLLCLRVWLKSGIIKLDEGLLRQVIVVANIDDNDDDEVTVSNKDSPIYLDNNYSNND
jgi:hypothetical protein